MKPKSAWSMWILLQAILPLAAQQGPEQLVVVTANGYPTPYENLARSVVVITREQIESLPVSSASDLLRLAAGVDVRARGGFGVQTDFSIRGATFGQALVMVDGIRLNDSQSGHHNGDIPIPLDAIDRVEILLGPGSSLYGADAFGGTIHFITREASARKNLRITGGEYGLFEVSGQAAIEKGSFSQSITGFANRSSGFQFARDFANGGFSTRLQTGRSKVLFGHVRKDFGANGFYGPSPSHEWTDQTLLGVETPLLDSRSWKLSAIGSYRNHGDHFLWDVRRPGFFENRHRTQGAAGTLKGQLILSDQAELNFGAEGGGDWIRSNNLGDHSFSRTAAFAELALRPGGRLSIYPGIRWDSYSNFGSSASPSLSAAWQILPVLQARASLGHAFRIPTFTELYYKDPNHAANSALTAETAWSTEAGLNWAAPGGNLLDLVVFSRWEDNVIDWIRASRSEKWSTTNIREVQTEGLELSWRRAAGPAWIGLQYSYLNSGADSVSFLSKYVLDYARHGLAGSASFRLPWGLQWGQILRFTHRSDGRNYWIWDGRLSRSFGRYMLLCEGFNLLGEQYQEIRGVDMPGRWLRLGFEIR